MDQVIAEIEENFRNSAAETETTDELDALHSVITEIADARTIAYSLRVVVPITALPIAATRWR